MFDKLTGIENRYEELHQQLMEAGDDYLRVAELNKERLDLLPLVEKIQAYRQMHAHLEEARSLLDADEAELRELAELEIATLEPQVEKLEAEIKAMLLPRDPRDQRNVIMEIRAGTGGDEAATFCCRPVPHVQPLCRAQRLEYRAALVQRDRHRRL